MTPQQLAEFDVACRESLKAGDAWLDRFLLDEMRRLQSSDLGTPTRTNSGRPGRPCYMVSRGIEAFEADVSEGRTRHGPSPSYMRMIEAANLGPILRKLHDDKSAGGELPEAIRHHFIGDGLFPAADGEALDPDEQALACLRLLQVYQETGRQPWLFTAAAMRLKELLLEHPVLMHPRLLWDVSNRKKAPHRQFEDLVPAPMAHIIVATINARLPSPNGLTEGAFRSFATHPVVGAGLTSPAPNLANKDASKASAFGMTVGEFMHESRQPALLNRFLTTVLAIHRVRLEAGLPGVVPSGHIAGGLAVSGFSDVTEESFRVAWSRAVGNPLDAAFIRELAANLASTPKSMTVGLFKQVSEIFIEERLDASDIPANDAWARFERFKANMVSVGLHQNASEIDANVFEYLLPRARYSPGVTDRFEHMAVAEADTAARFLDHWICEGRDIDAMQSSIHKYLPTSAWRTMIDVKKAEADMNRVIESQLVGAAGAPSTAPMRRGSRII
ncbi:hypothetical protein ABIC83_003036 [Roseateles asaccharophilus]|uniref:hypothetical protein n=1 Tax=Roseateles asaccharophilus TaxID=582607 RepID=UPI003835533B